MPELPEVETIVNDLKDVLPGKSVTGIDLFWKKSLNVTPAIFLNKLKNKKVKTVRRRAKTIIIDFGDLFLLIHLKMTGQLVWRDKNNLFSGGHPIVGAGMDLPNKFTRAIIKFGSQKLYFNDVRKFGWLRLLDKKELAEYEAKSGLEPLAKDFSYAKFRAVFQGRKTKIKTALLNQTLVAGLGNIYVDESLYSAGIRPLRLITDISEIEWKKLYQSIKAVLKKSIKYRGTSFSDYRDAKGRQGNFVKYLQVYGRYEKKCFKCGQAIKKIRLGGRGTHYCEHCQK
ncbi:MAG: bifunctional DNA-formamidopyrimidine glycosylase/DNA-(apurinic or apyrimidinic site) lyase [Patescibacteria group bacterium]|nr:bifunctional DNA-formamidopyrimidine glycosylase/DNA-(apurinic or apyrimidinic site) lyase [Patescibacteria group bacterium]